VNLFDEILTGLFLLLTKNRRPYPSHSSRFIMPDNIKNI